MSKITTKFLFFVLMFAGLSGSLSAQMQIPADIQQDIENRLAAAQNTIVTDANGRIIQIEIQPAPGTATEVLQLGYDNSGLSTVTDSTGRTITIQRNEAGAVKGFIFPDGGTVDLNSKGCIEIDSFNITYLNKTVDSLLYTDGFQSYRGPRGGGGSSACQDAAWAAALGLAICAANGPWTPACLGATAHAAYLALKCWRETHPPNQN